MIRRSFCVLLALAPACASFPSYDVALGADGGSDGGADTGIPTTSQCTPPIGAVDTSGPKTLVGTGTPASCTEADLRAKLATVPTGGVLGFDCGNQPVTITVTQTLVLDPQKSLVIEGNRQITLDGGGTVRIMSWTQNGFRANKQSLVLQGLGFAHGHSTGTALAGGGTDSDGGGGALYFEDGLLRIRDCTFQENAAPAMGPSVGGGGVFVASATSVQISTSTFYGNTASNGGGLAALNADVSVLDSSFRMNVAQGTGGNAGNGGVGGAISLQGGIDETDRFCGLRVVENRAERAGGLARLHFADPPPATTVEYSLIQGNLVTGDAGGMLLDRVAATLSAISVVDNQSPSAVGGLTVTSGTLDLVNSTIARNQGAFSGLYVGYGSGKIRNCTFAENHATAFNAAINGATNAYAVANTLFVNNESDNAQPTNPNTCGGGTDNKPSTPSALTGGGGCLQIPGTGYDTLCAPAVVVQDPQVGSLDETQSLPVYVPAASSPARTANTAFCPDTDALGHQRPATGCTAGAVQ